MTMAKLTLLSWNVRYFSQRNNGLRASDAGMAQVAAAIERVAPDIVQLQEVEGVSWRAGLHHKTQLERVLELVNPADEPAYRGFYFKAHSYPNIVGPPWFTTGLATLVRSPLMVEHCAEAHEITHRRFVGTRRLKQSRVCGHLRLRLAGDSTVDIYNTHLSLPAFLTAELKSIPNRMGHGTNQLEEVAALLRFVQSTRTAPAIISGDFNSVPGSPVYAAMIEAGLVDGFRSYAGLDVEELHGRPTAVFHKHIDYVFGSPEIGWLHTGDSHDWQTPGPFAGLSDHMPRVMRFEV
ncbi:MAG: endonuclease/exonuclease/phosphatase family metal-dependent hydrolase [Kiritimatiellia bacterium]|jgi:endonuclease/exonuclease/phosphatase family metal-dependent hydrolase